MKDAHFFKVLSSITVMHPHGKFQKVELVEGMVIVHRPYQDGYSIEVLTPEGFVHRSYRFDQQYGESLLALMRKFTRNYEEIDASHEFFTSPEEDEKPQEDLPTIGQQFDQFKAAIDDAGVTYDNVYATVDKNGSAIFGISIKGVGRWTARPVDAEDDYTELLNEIMKALFSLAKVGSTNWHRATRLGMYLAERA